MTAAGGTLTAVQMVNDAGKPIEGVITPDSSFWKPVVPLGYGRIYTITATSRGTGGVMSTQVSRFTTLKPGNQAKGYLNTTSGAALQDGGVYGVGIVVGARFDEPIADRAAAERRLTVTTSPAVSGSWYWADDQNAHWRPEHYYAPGTKVIVAADIYGASLGNGLYGQEDARVAFTIGDSHISIADDTTKQVSVYDSGRLVRTMPTSMGMGGTQQIGGRTLSFSTPRASTRCWTRATRWSWTPRRSGCRSTRGSAIAKPSSTPPASAPTAFICTSSTAPCGPRATPTPRTDV